MDKRVITIKTDVTTLILTIIVMIFIGVAVFLSSKIEEYKRKYIQDKTKIEAIDDVKVIEYNAEVTAYTPWDEPNPWLDGKTATGKDAQFPGCATAWDVIPPGSIVIVPDAGAFIVDDTGGACRRKWREEKKILIDIRLQSRKKALEWGRKHLKVKVILLKGGLR